MIQACERCRDLERFNKRLLAERNTIYDASDLWKLADELDEDNWATAAKKLREAIVILDRHEKVQKAWARLARAQNQIATGTDVVDDADRDERDAAKQALRDLGVPVDALLEES